MDTSHSSIEDAYYKMKRTIELNRSSSTCLRYWSQFIRSRDGHCCISCGRTDGLSAHHICRKSFLPEAALLTGNGITLCRKCHGEIHRGFNGKPDFNLPMDAQGGEKIETMVSLFGLLLRDAKERDLYDNRYYFISDSVLCKFKAFQGFRQNYLFPGQSLEQAFNIWNQAPGHLMKSILKEILPSLANKV